MKSLTTTVLVILSIQLFAQEITIYQEGKAIKTRVTATSSTAVFTNDGTFRFSEIDSMQTTDKALVEKFKLNASVSPSSSPSNGIIVNGVNISKMPDLEFIEVVATQFLLTKKVTISLYYGQSVTFFDNDQRIEDADRKPIRFYGTIDALNFLYKNGWDFVNAYAMSTENQNVYHYILRRKH